jgi:hypothetical protein
MEKLLMGLLILLSLVRHAPADVTTPRHSEAAAGQRREWSGAKPSSRRATDLDVFVRALRARGLKVVAAGEVSQPFFSPRGRALTVGGENVQVFRYSSGRAAEAEAKKVNAEGTSVGTSTAMWVGPPHFYKKGRLIILYAGDNESVMKALTAVLGPQFAGK